MQKLIVFEKDARSKIMDGINKAVDLVRKTLGPRGKSIIIKKTRMTNQGMEQYPAYATKDGISVLRDITLTDALENIGVDLCKEACEKTMTSTGDATTTTCVLLQALCQGAIEAIDGGRNPYEVKAGMEAAVADVSNYLQSIAVDIGDDIEAIRRIATISANNDAAIGNMIAEAFSKIGRDGIIDLQISNSAKTEIKIAEGAKFDDRGWISPYFITNHAKNEAELDNPYVLLYDKKIVLNKQILEVLKKIMQEGRSLLIICEDVDGEALAMLSMNARSGNMKVCAIKSPEFGDLRREAMEDFAKVTGATFIGDMKGSSLEKQGVTSLGSLTKAVIGRDSSTLIFDKGHTDQSSKSAAFLMELRLKLASIEDPKEREVLERRIARLDGGVAVLSVGATTEVEMKEKLDRCDDAVRATKAAIAEGYVPGGGTAFIRASQYLSTLVEEDKRDDFSYGQIIVLGALTEPLVQIAENAGLDSATVLTNVQKYADRNFGYNAKSQTYEDLLASGVIDPKKALRAALENAASVAGVLITSGGVNTDSFA